MNDRRRYYLKVNRLRKWHMVVLGLFLCLVMYGTTRVSGHENQIQFIVGGLALALLEMALIVRVDTVKPVPRPANTPLMIATRLGALGSWSVVTVKTSGGLHDFAATVLLLVTVGSCLAAWRNRRFSAGSASTTP